MRKAMLAPSVLAADFRFLEEQIKAVESGGADLIHIDIMDGHFVPNISFGPKIVKTVKKITSLPLDVHLMISRPDFYIEDFIGAGADYLTVHQESSVHCNRLLNQIRELGVKPGISINPGTPLGFIEELLPLAGLFLIMSVNPGFGGQEFIPSSLKRLDDAVEFRKKNNLDFLIEMDGGIDSSNALELAQRGCDVLVSGSGIFKKPDITKSVQKIKAEFSENGL